MTGTNTIHVCQAEICRLLSKALSDDVFKNPVKVTKLEVESEQYGTEHYSITMDDTEEVKDIKAA